MKHNVWANNIPNVIWIFDVPYTVHILPTITRTKIF